MVFFLVQDILDNGIDLRVRIRERPLAFLPGKPAARFNLLVDEVR